MDFATLDVLTTKAASNMGIAYVRVRHPSGKVLSERGSVVSLQIPFKADTDIDDASSDQIFDVSQEISVNGERFGSIELGLSIKAYEDLLDEAARYMSGLALFEIILVGIFGFVLGRVLTIQLSSLQHGARKVANGELGYTIQVRGKDELADTAKSFNAMSLSLQDYAQDLKKARDKAEAGRLHAESLLHKAVESLPQGIVITDKNDRVVHLNQAFADIYEIRNDEMASMRSCADVHRVLQQGNNDDYTCNPELKQDTILTSKLPNGRYILHGHQSLTIGGAVWVVTDITRLIEAENRSRTLERELLQSQKMESIGTLASGIAHEINTPIQYIGDNLNFIGSSISNVMKLLDSYEKMGEEICSESHFANLIEQCQTQTDDADVEFLRDELPQAVEQSLQGVQQVSKIILAMKEFAHPSSKKKSQVDINRIVERSLIICKNTWKSVAHVELHLEKDIPVILAHESDLNQVVLNLIVNAAHAIAEKGQENGQIDITTKRLPDSIALLVRDNGSGIPDDIIESIFDPFFTTKGVGKGSGQGLAICYDIVVNKHDGRIGVQSSPGEETTFDIKLPITESPNS
jgi:signal transduction histidine kinase/HAMP domain-containing protein